MEKEFYSVTLESLGNGAANEMFETELLRVLGNILDPNTEPEALRKITLELKIKPTKDREMGNCEISVTSKLSANAAYPTRFFIGRENGRPVAYENNPRQLSLEEEENEKIVKMKNGEA